jgi:hypothetical protein
MRTRDPIAHRFVDGVLERLAAGLDTFDARAEQSHAKHVQGLAPHVLGAHVDHAFETQQRACRRAGDAMLSRSRFSDDAGLAHALGEQRLAEGVVDLVRAGVREVLALQKNARPVARLAQAPGLPQRRRPAGVVMQQSLQLRREGRFLSRLEVRRFERFDRRDERLRHKAAAVRAVVPARVRVPPSKPVCRLVHTVSFTA